MLIIELTLISLIILTILTQNLTIRIYDKDELHISLSLTILSLELSPKNQATQQKRRRKSGRKMSLGAKISYYSLLLRLFYTLIGYSRIMVYKLAPYSETSQNITKLIGGAVSIPIFLAYIYSIAEEFELEENGAIGEKIDISIDIPFILLIISLIKVAYFKIKLRFAEGVKKCLII